MLKKGVKKSLFRGFLLRVKVPERRKESDNFSKKKRLSDSDNKIKKKKKILFFLCGPVPNGPRSGTGGWGMLNYTIFFRILTCPQIEIDRSGLL